MPMRGELPPARTRTIVREAPSPMAWSRLRATVWDQDFQFVSSLCIIGFLVAINLILRFPDFGAVAATYPFFP